ncbi:MAG TPA: condensation domain-containing protein [Methylomirabilota bacterium]|nr:condensation domain-containing protein [Methylomirabilota bacterium]
MPADQRTRLKQWLDSGEAQLHPLTLPQRELWEVSPVPIEDSANHICCLIDVQGLLTERECRAALQLVIDREEVLRLSVLPGRERPLQMIRKSCGINFDVREVCAAPAAIEELVLEIFRTPFDLMQGLLYRVVDLRRTANDHVLVFAIHHAIADGWSLGIFVEELFAAYLQAITGSSKALPPVPQTYAAWGAAERAFWTPEILEPRIEFWKTRLAASSRMWNATVTPGPPKRWLSAIPASLTNETRELARRTSITFFSALFGTFQIAFSEWSGFDDLAVGTPVANRTRQTARETMGYYASIVPLRGQIDRSRVASDHLRAAHQVTIDSFANAIPFVELVRGIGEQAAAGYNPLFEVRFALQNHPMPEISLPNLSARLSMRSTGTARFQLACEITEEHEGLEVAWLFRENLFSQRDIESLDGIFQRVLAGICRSPESRISEVLNQP